MVLYQSHQQLVVNISSNLKTNIKKKGFSKWRIVIWRFRQSHTICFTIWASWNNQLLLTNRSVVSNRKNVDKIVLNEWVIYCRTEFKCPYLSHVKLSIMQVLFMCVCFQHEWMQFYNIGRWICTTNVQRT